MKRYSKKIGQYHVEVNGDKISITGNFNSNVGHFYASSFERFKAHPKGENHDWNRPQILGMQWSYGLVPSVKAWLYSLVLKDKIEA